MGYSRFLTRVMICWYRVTLFFTGFLFGSEVRRAKSIGEVLDRLEYGRLWRADKGHGDFITHPRRIQRRIEDKAPIGDCDDHAAYWCAVLHKSGLAKRVWMGWVMLQPHKGSGRVGRFGHCICIFEHSNGGYYWVDYEMPTLHSHPEILLGEWGWATEVAHAYDSDPVCATLCPVEIGPKDGIRFWDYEIREFPQ